ncbi:MAG TPA: hypothetical protein VN634_11630 [Candidatus Limnocylindrales bacterium]|nr:hypothetical protein [Candidatus Limnocylindrales bacterium]
MQTILAGVLAIILAFSGTAVAGGKPDGAQCHVSRSCASRLCVTLVPTDKFGVCCTPNTCAGLGAQCGSVANGCGIPIDCGPCDVSSQCTDNICVAMTTTTTTSSTSTTTSSTSTSLAPTCIADGETSSGSFGGIFGAQNCIDSLAAACCSGESSASACDCTGSGIFDSCSGSGTCLPTCIADGETSSGSFGGIFGAQYCLNGLAAACCSGESSASSCDCTGSGIFDSCSGSGTCVPSCIAAGETSSGSFGGIFGAPYCHDNLAAACCSGQASSTPCECTGSGILDSCSGSVVCE